MNGRPSWAAAAPVREHPAAHRRTERPPATLLAAAAATVLLAAAVAVEVAGRDDLRPGLRAALIAGVALQGPGAALLLRRSPTAAMLLLLCTLGTGVAALAAGDPALAVGAAVVLVLLASSLRSFPAVEPWPS